MALDELNQAFTQFQAGLQQLQASRVLTQANEAVTQIRNSELDATEKNNQLRALGQQMAFGLASQGVGAGQIEALANTFMPAKPTPIQSLEQGLLSDDPAMRERAQVAYDYKQDNEAKKLDWLEAQKDRRQQASFAQQKEMYGIRSEDVDQDKIRGELTNFRKTVAGENFKSLDKLNSARDLLATDSNAAMGLVTRLMVGSTGDARVSDQDAEAVAPNPDVASTLKRKISIMAKGKPIEADQQELGLIMDALELAQKRSIKTKAGGYAKSRKDILRGMSENDFYSRIAVDSGFADQVDPQMEIPSSTPQATPPPLPNGSRNKYIKF
jgi:hypothetical protein